MKRLFLLILISIVGFGCENPNNEGANLDEYYVKYELGGSTIYYSTEYDVTVNTENNNTMAFVTPLRWELVIGPVPKGFNASLKAKSTYNVSQLNMSAQISVSKNGSPFALKKNDGEKSRQSVEINYTIDY